MELDKKLAGVLSRRIERERMKVEEETLRAWQERIESVIRKSNDYKSLSVNIKKLLQQINNRLQVLQSEIRELA